MPLTDIANISISVSGAGPTLAGFGEPMCLAYHTAYTDRSREYSDLSGVAGDFAVTAPAYLMAQAVFSQIPSPPALKIGRRALPYTQVLHLTCLSTSATDTYVFNLRTPGGSWKNVTVASTGTVATDVATIATAVTALGIAHLTASSSSPNVILTMATGYLLDVQPDVVHCKFVDVTPDPGLATDIAAVIAADPNWYGLLTDSQSSAEVQAGAANIEAEGGAGYIYIYNNSDTANTDPSSTTDVLYELKNSSYERTSGLHAQSQLLCYSAAAWMGRMFPTVAGSENWAFKTLAGIPADALTTAQIHAVEAKNASVYTNIAGLNLTQFGKTPGGEWIDIVRGTDALKNVMGIGILALQANSLKVPYTAAGLDMYYNVISASLKHFVDSGFLSDTPAPTIKIPALATITSTNKAARVLPNVSFSATYAGAINATTINGVLSA